MTKQLGVVRWARYAAAAALFAAGVARSSTAAAQSEEVPGVVWNETESGWNGTWTRRGATDTFDAVWAQGAGRVTAVLRMRVFAGLVAIERRQSSDGNNCNYLGRIAADGVNVRGSYSCTNGGDAAWQATIVAAPELPRVFNETESGWSGVWTRRPGTNTYDAVWTQGAGRVTAVLTVDIQGSQVRVQRRQSSDRNDCDYEGTIAADGVTVAGPYRCRNGNSTWQARIVR